MKPFMEMPKPITNKVLSNNRGYLYAVMAAVLFGASTPAAKTLIVQVHPWLLAGLLYLGSAVGLSVIFAIQSLSTKEYLREAPLTRDDWKWLGVAIVLGGILSPVFLMIGISKISAATASLLLNLESVFTSVIAWFIFKEFVDKKLAFGMLLILVGSGVLSWIGQPTTDNIVGVFFIAASCLLWACDNNLTRKISASDPLQIALLKCFIAGLTNTFLAYFWVDIFPSYRIIFFACLIGFVGYGLSLYCYVLGLRHIGAARTGAYFSLAPFVGAGLAIIFLNESVSLQFIVACSLMGIGIWLHLTEYHDHEHQHEALEHSHRHVHDEHHQHEHLDSAQPGEPHTHFHKHKPIRHSHPHYPDIHHRHKH